jgi:peptidoglycan hydrolase-like protein with peptidoglycan-binding domain
MRKLCTSLMLVMIFFMGLFFSPDFGNAQSDLDLTQLIELFISLEIIPENKAEKARSVLNEYEISPTTTNVTDQVIPAFSRNLSLGARGEDVRTLQVFLNKNIKTRVAESGPGSPGQETDFFGPLTKKTVIKFQELYANDVLVPVGLTRGTGFVGPSTIKKLNELSNSSLSTALDTLTTYEFNNTFSEINITNKETSGTAPEISNEELTITFPSVYSGLPGTKLTLTGTGFDSRTVALFDGEEVATFVKDETSLHFFVPAISPGRYDVLAVNDKNASNGVQFTVEEPGATQPKIVRLEPKSGTGEARVTIRGEGFSKTANRIYTGYSVLENVPSTDGRTLEITLRPPSFQAETKAIIEKNLGVSNLNENPEDGVSEDMWIYVENTAGLSNVAIFKYTP